MVECSPATRAARVRFPADAMFYTFVLQNPLVELDMLNSASERIDPIGENEADQMPSSRSGSLPLVQTGNGCM